MIVGQCLLSLQEGVGLTILGHGSSSCKCAQIGRVCCMSFLIFPLFDKANFWPTVTLTVFWERWGRVPYSSKFSWHNIFVIFVINPSFTNFLFTNIICYIVISKLMGVAFSTCCMPQTVAEIFPPFLKQILHIEVIFLRKCPTIPSSSPCSCETLTVNGHWLALENRA